MIRMLLLLILAPLAAAQTPAQPKDKPKGITPTKENVKYGPHERNVLDVFLAKSDSPTPVVFCIHGGGWVNGDKGGYRTSAQKFLDAGLSVVAINYRYTTQAADVDPPVKAPLHDAARALQFVRAHAKEWNMDPTRIGATGGSAGACSSLWLLYHDDLADPKNTDPILRESTRLTCAAVSGAQTTLDPKVVREWMPNAKYGGHAFGVTSKENRDGQFQAFWEKRDALLPKITEYSPASHVSKGDGPAFLDYKTAPKKGESQGDPTHAAMYGEILMEKCKDAGVECFVSYPGHTHDKYKTTTDYLIGVLKK